MPKNLVIVESPAKAKTIEKYLGKDFKVLSSVGHIRRDTKVDPENDFSVTYEIDPGHKKVVSELKKSAKAADTIWLATDEDREGESISWHLLEVLKLPKDTRRITFHEITKPALEEAIKNPRTVDMDMVASQQARQSLDMLVGYDLSGVVRVKVPGAISAGRVQSPALRLIVEKEREIEKFDSKYSFKVSGEFGKDGFPAVLEKKAIDTEEEARSLLESFSGAKYQVSSVSKTEGKKANPVPFTTAALQIEANSRLGYSSSTTMRAAQGLYQAGLITYHRTDSLNLSKQAIAAMAAYIEKEFGKEYLQVRHFKTKDASAQEAHEAIRPTDINKVSAGANNYEKRLYELIRSRTLATQMANAKVAKTTVALEPFNSDKTVGLSISGSSRQRERTRGLAPATAGGQPGARDDKLQSGLKFVAKGEIVIFDGFLRVYGKSKDVILPDLAEGDEVEAKKIVARQTFAKPPARYTEGSLVKKLEELGIGRPSTYAGIISAIQARNYVVKGESEGEERDVIELTLENDGERDTAESISASNGNENLSGTGLSARRRGGQPSRSLPLSRRSRNDFVPITRSVVQEKSGSTKGKLLPTPVGELVSDFLAEHFNQIVDYGFTAGIEEKLDEIADKDKKLDRVKMLRDFYTPFAKEVENSAKIERYNNATELGVDPKTKKKIYAKIGRNGGFIQLGENEKESGEKPRFAPLPDGKTVKTVTFSEALAQLALPALPRSLGKAKDGTEIIAAAGPFGPYLKAGKYNIPMKGYDPYTISLSEAEPLYQVKIDSIIADWGDVMIINGAYGPYIKGPGRRNNLKIPKDEDPKKITEAEAREMLENKPKTRRRAPRARKKKS